MRNYAPLVVINRVASLPPSTALRVARRVLKNKLLFVAGGGAQRRLFCGRERVAEHSGNDTASRRR